jgi:predicted MFS family arabinose efflux permease
MTGMVVLLVAAFVDMVGFAMILPLLPYYASDLRAGEAVVGVRVSAFALAQLATAPGWRARRHTRHAEPLPAHATRP